MTAAYIYADGGPQSSEIRLLSQIDRFGVQAVLGRMLWAKEIIRLRTAENIVRLYHERLNASSWAEWASANTNESALLNYCAKLVNDGESE